MISTSEGSEAIIERIIGGDDNALKKLYKDHFDKIKALAHKHARSETDAEDVFQESLVDMIKNFTADKFRGEASVGTYLYSICRNKFLNLNRNERIKTTELKGDVKIISLDVDNDIIEEEQILLSEIKNISEDCQKVLSLFYFYKKPWKEIAEHLGYSEKFVRVKSNRCKNELRKRLLQTPTFKSKYGS